MNKIQQHRSAPTMQPTIGKFYRDDKDRSLVILTMDEEHVLVEFADGAIKRISLEKWQEMQPEPALF